MEIKRKFEYDKTYMEIAKSVSNLSYAKRSKVGAIIVSPNGQIISQGYNGTPEGRDNCCEIEEKINDNECVSCKKNCDGCSNIKLITKDEVLHAESNAISKCCKYGGCSNNCTVYVTLSPCMDCAKLMIQAGISRVVYDNEYRILEGIRLLVEQGIEVDQIDSDNNILYKLIISDDKLVKYPLDITVEDKINNAQNKIDNNSYLSGIKDNEQLFMYTQLKMIYKIKDDEKLFSKFLNPFGL